MNQLKSLPARDKAATRITRNSKLFKTIINAILERKGENIISLDLRKIPEAISDFFIVCEATTNTQVKAIADAVQDDVKAVLNELPFKSEGYDHAKWILVDFVNVIVHVMQPETRRFYKLEDMWSDAPLAEHTDPQTPKKS
ncbi:MAG: ribosome silencing factor [Bacteroidetes bacterium]|nr:MAG: ribosome silencing factor [Bacteroidota bacterium]